MSEQWIRVPGPAQPVQQAPPSYATAARAPGPPSSDGTWMRVQAQLPEPQTVVFERPQARQQFQRKPKEDRTKCLHLDPDSDIYLNVEFETNHLATIGQLIATGLGVSAMPSLYSEQLKYIHVECRPLTSPVVSRRVGIITKRRSELSAPAMKFKQLIQL